MSLATRQAMLMLSAVNGSIKLIGNEPTLPPDVAPTVLWADGFCRELLDRYPETGDRLRPPAPRRLRGPREPTGYMMTYFKHMMANFAVAKKALREAVRQAVLAFLHVLHGVIPCKYTSHEFYDI